MGLKEMYYQWQESRLERKIKELRKMLDKKEASLKKIQETGYGKPKLLLSPKKTPQELKKELFSPKLERDEIDLDSVLDTSKGFKTLTSIKAEKVFDPGLYLSEDFDPLTLIQGGTSVEMYGFVDTRNPQSVVTPKGIVYAQSNASLTSDIYSPALTPSLSSNTREYALSLGTHGDLAGKPLEYLEISRGDGSNFYLAERFSNDSLANKHSIKEYSIKRYNPTLKCYEEDIIFSEGIDLARVIDNDIEYVSMLGNRLLSEERLQKCLAKPQQVRNVEQTNEITHGAGYVGYLNATTLQTHSHFNDFEALQSERESLPNYQKSYSAPCKETDVLKQMHPDKYSRSVRTTDSQNHVHTKENQEQSR